ncbi:adenylosuccinate lyase, partial [Amylibacter sp.]|nr:adenylosuccinate lyase [Amylibacter sp.]
KKRNDMRVWEEGADFMTELKNDKDVMEVMNEAEIEDKFDLQYHTKHVDTIFSRVFNSEV